MEERKPLEVLWTVEQVATYFSIRKRTVYDWIATGRMINPEKIVHVGNLVRIPRSEIERIANTKKDAIAKTVKAQTQAPAIVPAPAKPARPAITLR